MNTLDLVITYRTEKVGPSLSIQQSDIEQGRGLFGFFYLELLQEAFEKNIKTVNLELTQFIGDELTKNDCMDVVYAYGKLYNLHRDLKSPKTIGWFTKEQVRETKTIFIQLGIVQRTILLSLIHFIGSEHILDVSCKVFANIISGLSTENIISALGYA